MWTVSRLSRWSINYYNDTANQAHAAAMDGKQKLQEIAAKTLGGKPEQYERKKRFHDFAPLLTDTESDLTTA